MFVVTEQNKMNCLSFTGKPLLSWIPSSKVIKKVVIFLHGSGDSGSGVSSWLESLGAKTEFDRLDIGVVFPRERNGDFWDSTGLLKDL